MKEERENRMSKYMPYILGSATVLILSGVFLFGRSYQTFVESREQTYNEIYHQSELVITADEFLMNDNDIPYDQKSELINSLENSYSDFITCVGDDYKTSNRCSIERDKISMEVGVIDAYLEKSSNPTFEDFDKLISKDKLDELIEQEPKTEEGE